VHRDVHVSEPAASSLELPATAQTVSVARRHVRLQLAAWDLETLTDTVVLLTSEVVTNMLIHTGGDGRLELTREGDGVRVTIIDTSPVLPSQRRHSTTATTGRGCRLLQDLSDAWGAEPRGAGKAVWFTASAGRDPWAELDAHALLSEADL
jgi:anti-sigma regulatory factor (Ser/Thr protein kinase)